MTYYVEFYGAKRNSDSAFCNKQIFVEADSAIRAHEKVILEYEVYRMSIREAWQQINGM